MSNNYYCKHTEELIFANPKLDKPVRGEPSSSYADIYSLFLELHNLKSQVHELKEELIFNFHDKLKTFLPNPYVYYLLYLMAEMEGDVSNTNVSCQLFWLMEACNNGFRMIRGMTLGYLKIYKEQIICTPKCVKVILTFLTSCEQNRENEDLVEYFKVKQKRKIEL